MKRNGNGPVVAIDIDGTLGDYHTHFLKFAKGWIGRPMPDPEDINPGLPLHKFMGTSKATYRKCKLAYRQGGLKRSMPCYYGAKHITEALRRAGVEVWICTTRPYLRLDNIDPDTRHWLRRNGIQYDAVLWGEHKYRDLVKQVDRERIVGVLDDLPAMLDQAHSLGLRTLLRDQPYNRQKIDAESVCPYALRVEDLPQAQCALTIYLGQWKDDHNES